MFMPPVMRAILLAASSWAMRRASLKAASTISWSMSTSSGSTAWGSMTTLLTSSVPLMVTLTAPPPAEASTNSLASSSWARAMSACILWTRLSICWGFATTAFLSVEIVVEHAGLLGHEGRVRIGGGIAVGGAVAGDDRMLHDVGTEDVHECAAYIERGRRRPGGLGKAGGLDVSGRGRVGSGRDSGLGIQRLELLGADPSAAELVADGHLHAQDRLDRVAQHREGVRRVGDAHVHLVARVELDDHRVALGLDGRVEEEFGLGGHGGLHVAKDIAPGPVSYTHLTLP